MSFKFSHYPVKEGNEMGAGRDENSECVILMLKDRIPSKGMRERD